MKNYITIDWNKVLLWLIPPILRKQKQILWLRSLLAPLISLYTETLYNMQHTGQVIYLEKMLNEKFNPTRQYNPNYSLVEKEENQLIYIADSFKPTIKYVYLNEEYELGYTPLMLYTHDEIENKLGEGINLPNVIDYTEIAYANFRIMIPELLNVNLGDLDGLEEVQKMRTLANEIYYESPEVGSIRDSLSAIEVKTPRFHELINFYKLAGKTYDTYKYKTTTELPVDSSDF